MVSFKRSSYCTDRECLEMAFNGTVLVRDSKQVVDGVAPILRFPARDWIEFLAKFAGRFPGPSVS